MKVPKHTLDKIYEIARSSGLSHDEAHKIAQDIKESYVCVRGHVHSRHIISDAQVDIMKAHGISVHPFDTTTNIKRIWQDFAIGRDIVDYKDVEA